MAEVPPSSPGGRMRRRDPQTCAVAPALLAARASGHLNEADRARLARHLSRCDRCRTLEAAFARGERAYLAAESELMDAATGSLLVKALAAAAPTGAAPGDDAAADQPPATGEDVPARDTRPARPDRAEPAASAPDFPVIPPISPYAPMQTSAPRDAPDPDEQLGETMEWSAVRRAGDADDAQAHANGAEPRAPATNTTGSPAGDSAPMGKSGRALRAIVPTIVLATAAAVALSVAGAFRKDPPPAPPAAAPVTAGLPSPVTTPLPLPPAAAEKPGAGATTP
jgi:hypothetical protein